MSDAAAAQKFLDALAEMGTLDELVDRLVAGQDGRLFMFTFEIGDGEVCSIPYVMREPPKMPVGQGVGIDDEGDYTPWGLDSQVPHYSWVRGDRVLAVREIARGQVKVKAEG